MRHIDSAFGIQSVLLDSWNEFPSLVASSYRDASSYVFRGHRKASWQLRSTLGRALALQPRERLEDMAAAHLARFKLATRGRRGTNPATMVSDNDWWALGQHYGLATPLLDWTLSPFVAAYFAFHVTQADDEEYRAVIAVTRDIVEANSLMDQIYTSNAPHSIVEFFTPQSDENSRLVIQSGLFSRIPLDTPLENLVLHFFANTISAYIMKILIPSRDREMALKDLNRMNINQASLFPDLTGASAYMNMALEFPLIW